MPVTFTKQGYECEKQLVNLSQTIIATNTVGHFAKCKIPTYIRNVIYI